MARSLQIHLSFNGDVEVIAVCLGYPAVENTLRSAMAMGADRSILVATDLTNQRVETSQYSGKTIASIALTGSHFIYGLRANVVAPVKKKKGVKP